MGSRRQFLLDSARVAALARFADGAESQVIVPLTDAAERQRWQAVACAQRALVANDLAGARTLLTECRDWPDDASVRRWLERVRHHVGLGLPAGPLGLPKQRHHFLGAGRRPARRQVHNREIVPPCPL